MSISVQFYIWLAYTFILSMWVIFSIKKEQHRFTWRDLTYMILGAIHAFLMPDLPR